MYSSIADESSRRGLPGAATPPRPPFGEPPRPPFGEPPRSPFGEPGRIRLAPPEGLCGPAVSAFGSQCPGREHGRSREVRGPRLVVNVDSVLDMTPTVWYGARHYFATARYLHEPEEVSSRRTPAVKANPSSTSPDKENCVLHHSINMPFDPGQDTILVSIYEMGVRSDVFIGEATVPLNDPRCATTSPWPLVCQGVRTGTLTLNIKAPTRHDQSHLACSSSVGMGQTSSASFGPGGDDTAAPRPGMIMMGPCQADRATRMEDVRREPVVQPAVQLSRREPVVSVLAEPVAMSSGMGGQSTFCQQASSFGPTAEPAGAPRWPAIAPPLFPPQGQGGGGGGGWRTPPPPASTAAFGKRMIPVEVEVVPPHMSELNSVPMASAQAFVSLPCPYQGQPPLAVEFVGSAPV